MKMTNVDALQTILVIILQTSPNHTALFDEIVADFKVAFAKNEEIAAGRLLDALMEITQNRTGTPL